jgi:hypothetical protein
MQGPGYAAGTGSHFQTREGVVLLVVPSFMDFKD